MKGVNLKALFTICFVFGTVTLSFGQFIGNETNILTSVKKVSPGEWKIVLPANMPQLDTLNFPESITVHKGQTINITAVGKVNASGYETPNDGAYKIVGPYGWNANPEFNLGRRGPLPSTAPFMALAMRIGTGQMPLNDGQWTLIGSRKTIVVNEYGSLHFTVNDVADPTGHSDWWANNEGGLIIHVQLDPKPLTVVGQIKSSGFDKECKYSWIDNKPYDCFYNYSFTIDTHPQDTGQNIRYEVKGLVDGLILPSGQKATIDELKSFENAWVRVILNHLWVRGGGSGRYNQNSQFQDPRMGITADTLEINLISTPRPQLATVPMLIPFRVGDKFGFCDINKRIIIEPKYDHVRPFSEGLALVVLNGKARFIDKTGKVIIPINYYMAGSFSEGLALVATQVKMDIGGYSPLFGFINKAGKVVIPLKYTHASDFSGGLTIVEFNERMGILEPGKMGALNKKGEIIIPLKYNVIQPFSDGLARVSSTGEEGGFIDRTGKLIISTKYDGGKFSDGLAAICTINTPWERKCGYMDKTGSIVIPPIYSDALDFSEGLALVKLDDQWSLINKNAEKILSLKNGYSNIDSFSEGLANVENNERKRGYIDKTGTEVIALKYDYVHASFSNGLAEVRLNGKSFFIDKNGTEYYEPNPTAFVGNKTFPITIESGYVDVVESSGSGCRIRFISGDKSYTGIVSFDRLSVLTGRRLRSYEDALAFFEGRQINITLSGLAASNDGISTGSFGGISRMTVVPQTTTTKTQQRWNERTTATETIIDLSTDILFDFNKSTINPNAVPSLIKLARLLRQSKGNAVQLNGFTDSIGTDEYNIGLSKRRSDAVKQWLVTKGGIDAGRLVTNGYGKGQPVAPNTNADGSDNPTGRQKNRRVEIRIPRN